MIEAVQIFISQYFMIMLLGLQSLNVNQGKKLAAAITSMLLGICGFVVTGIIAQAYQDGFLTLTFASFFIAGPLGIVSSIIVHPKLKRLFNGD